MELEDWEIDLKTLDRLLDQARNKSEDNETNLNQFKSTLSKTISSKVENFDACKIKKDEFRSINSIPNG